MVGDDVADLAKHETSRSVASTLQRTSDLWPAHKGLNAAGSEVLGSVGQDDQEIVKDPFDKLIVLV